MQGLGLRVGSRGLGVEGLRGLSRFRGLGLWVEEEAPVLEITSTMALPRGSQNFSMAQALL